MSNTLSGFVMLAVGIGLCLMCGLMVLRNNPLLVKVPLILCGLPVLPALVTAGLARLARAFRVRDRAAHRGSNKRSRRP